MRNTKNAAKRNSGRPLKVPSVKTLRLGVSVLAQIVAILDKGGELVFRNPDGTERRVVIPKLGLGRNKK